MNYTTEEMTKTWDEKNTNQRWLQLWRLHEQVCPEAPVLTSEEKDKCAEFADGTTHEVIKALYDHIANGRLGANAHLGLTSSDIIDNARMLACAESQILISDGLEELGRLFNEILPDKNVIAYTHMLEAKKVNSYSYVYTWDELLDDIGDVKFKLRGFRGSVGNEHDELGQENEITQILREASKNLTENCDLELEPPILMQTWSPLSALDVIQYIQRVTVVLNKIAQDCRYLIGLGQMERFTKDTSASSTLVHKRANPAEFERCIALCRLAMSDCSIMFQTVMTQILSRSLDDSAVWRECLPRTWGYLHFVTRSLMDELTKWQFVETKSKIQNEETAIMQRIIKSKGKTSRVHEDLKARGIV